MLSPNIVLNVGAHCNLRCYGCSQGFLPPSSAVLTDLVSKIMTQTFFDEFPKNRQYNIIGGEPLLQPRLETLVTYLREHECQVTLWTNGINLIHYDKTFLSLFNTIMVYLPSPNPDEYRAITGVDMFEDCCSALDYLKEDIGANYGVHFPVTDTSIQYLPDIYELTYKRQIKLMLHYSPKIPFTGDSLAYIKRFRGIKNVEVIVSSRPSEGNCRYIPVQGILDIKEGYRNKMDELIISLRQKFGL